MFLHYWKNRHVFIHMFDTRAGPSASKWQYTVYTMYLYNC